MSLKSPPYLFIHAASRNCMHEICTFVLHILCLYIPVYVLGKGYDLFLCVYASFIHLVLGHKVVHAD